MALTYKGISLGYREGNPFGLWAMQKFGLLRGMVYLKLTMLPWLSIIYWRNIIWPLVCLTWLTLFVAVIPWVMLLYFPQ